MKNLISLLAGLLFGAGLAISGMMNPAKVIGFLDITGHWDPSLAFVMGGALLVNIPAYWLSRRRAAPVLAPQFQLPTRRELDPSLALGAALFGAGWGLAGLCPGPALASLSSGSAWAFGFCAAMLLGMAAASVVQRRRAKG